MSTKPYKGMGMEGAVAKWYAGLTRKSLEDFKALARRTAEQIPPRSRVLEVAPGPGYFAIELAKLGDYRITGLDISETFVDIARANAAAANVRVDFRQGNASAMRFPDSRFDFILCRAAFKNFSQPDEALAEMHRVLKPGGRALVVDMQPHDRESYRQQMGHVWLGFSDDHLRRLFNEAGFEEINIVALPPDARSKGPALFVATAKRPEASR